MCGNPPARAQATIWFAKYPRELVEQLRGVDPATDHFGELAKQLSTEVRDRLDEEEHGTFQLAGKLLSKTQQKQLARDYRTEYAKRGGPYSLG